MYLYKRIVVDGNIYEFDLVGGDLFITLPNRLNDYNCMDVYNVIDEYYNGLYKNLIFTRSSTDNRFMLVVTRSKYDTWKATNLQDATGFKVYEISTIIKQLNDYVNTNLK